MPYYHLERYITDVMLRDATIIGKAEIYTVVGNMQIGGLDEAPYYRLP